MSALGLFRSLGPAVARELDALLQAPEKAAADALAAVKAGWEDPQLGPPPAPAGASAKPAQSKVVPFRGSAVPSSPLSLAQTLAALRAPDVVLEAMLAAQETGFVQSWFDRQESTVPAGTTQVFTDEVPSGWVTFVVAYRTAVDPASSSVQVTTSLDQQAPFAQGVPMPGDWTLRGAFLPPVQFSVEYTVVGDPDRDVTFAREIQAALVDARQYRLVLLPLFAGWFRAIGRSQGVVQ